MIAIKHELRHTRPFKCRYTNCSKNHEGFPTQNDCDRHMQSVHKAPVKNGVIKGYRCPSNVCKSKDKLWTRLDNYRNHLKRMHKQDNILEFVRRCEKECLVEKPAVNGELDHGQPGGNQSLEPSNLDSREPRNYVSMETLDARNHWRPSTVAEPRIIPNGYRPGPQVRSPPLEMYRDRPATSPGHPPVMDNEPRGSPTNRSRLGSSDSETKPELDVTIVELSGKILKTVTNAISEQVGEQQAISTGSGSTFRQNHSDSKESQVIVIEHPPPSGQHRNQPYEDRPSPQACVEDLGSGLVRSLMANFKTNSGEEVSKKMQFQIQEILRSGLSNHLYRSHGPSNGVGNRSSGPIPAKKEFQCPHCTKTLPRECDMRKHVKRHTRPYGCTFRGCRKIFGSKNDWKRHENSQHFQLEMWRCRQNGLHGKDCAKIFYRRESFQNHLEKAHQLSNEQKIKQEITHQRIGRNRQSRFWCGFCREIIDLTKRGLEAWDERFTHIGDHFNKEKKNISEWVPEDSNCPIGDIITPAGDVEIPGGDSPIREQHPHEDVVVITAPNVSNAPNGSFKGDGIHHKDHHGKRDAVWFCCQCAAGPQSEKLFDYCPSCARARCEGCTIEISPTERK